MRELTPETSYGFDVVDFAADVLGEPLDPWEEWAVIHAGELLPDGRPRFRVVLILVARQNGKTHLLRVLTLFWLFLEEHPLILGTSTTLAYAKEQWMRVVDLAYGCAWLAGQLGPRDEAVRRAGGEECLTTLAGAKYRPAAANRRAGRSLTVHRLVLDELREHQNFDTWNASVNAMNAVPDGQVMAITNQGDDNSVVLDSLRTPGIRFIETGQGDPRLGLFEWSAPAGSDPTDLRALAMANPNLGRRVDVDALVGAGLRAADAGGEELASYRTEVMCIRVDLLDPAVDPELWEACMGDVADLSEHRDVVALCLDVSLDGQHATLVAAALLDGMVHVDVVAAWDGAGCTRQVRAELPALVAKVKPRVFGWFPNGPAAALTTALSPRRGLWPPRRVDLNEITSDTAAVCMALPTYLPGREIRHNGDELVKQHVRSAQKLRTGDKWVFTRRGTGAVDAVYAVAGAVHLARTLRQRAPLKAL